RRLGPAVRFCAPGHRTVRSYGRRPVVSAGRPSGPVVPRAGRLRFSTGLSVGTHRGRTGFPALSELDEEGRSALDDCWCPTALLLGRDRDDVHHPAATAGAELHRTGGEGEQRVV